MLTRLAIRCLAAIALFASAGWANAACYDSRQQLPAQNVSAFLGNPGDLLTQYPDGGAQLISRIRDLVASDPATLPVIIGLLSTATQSQQSAIGSGLGQAYRICIGRDQAFATQIQQAVAGSPSSFAKDSYAAVNPDVPIGVAGGAGGAGAGGTGVGGPTTGFGAGAVGGFSQPFGLNSTANTSTTSLTGGRAGGAGGLTAPVTSVLPVSPR